MARPRPIAVVRLRAKIDTSVKPVSTFSATKVPTIDSAPMARGRRAATRLPNTKSEQQQGHRQGDRLGPDEVGLDGRADLAEHLGEARHRHVEGPVAVAAAEGGRDLGDRLVDRVLVAAEAGEHERLRAVLAPQRGRRGEAPVRDRLLRPVGGRELGGERRARGDRRRGVDPAGRGHDEHDVGLARPELLAEGVAGEVRLGARVLEAAAREVLATAPPQAPEAAKATRAATSTSVGGGR